MCIYIHIYMAHFSMCVCMYVRTYVRRYVCINYLFICFSIDIKVLDNITVRIRTIRKACRTSRNSIGNYSNFYSM